MEQNKSFTNSDTLVFSSVDILKQQSPPATQRIKVESVHVVLEGESQTLWNGEPRCDFVLRGNDSSGSEDNFPSDVTRIFAYSAGPAEVLQEPVLHCGM